MRKLILIIALVMVPLGIWTAGCRNDQQAAFPDTPEMKSLAGSSDNAVSEVAAAPVIPAKPIDREILHYPDNATLARVQAVRDRANLYASEKAGHGLFTLPEGDNYMASASSAAPAAGSADNAAMTIPAPSAREFWSRPVADRGNAGSRPASRSLPEDVSAMAGPSRGEEESMIPPPPTRAPAARLRGTDTLAPVTAPAARLRGAGEAAPRIAPTRAARDELILPPDDLPGVFIVGEADDPLDAPPPARGWFGMLRNDRGDARGAPPLSSRAGRASMSSPSRSVERRLLSAAGARPRAEVTRNKPMLLPIDKLVGVDAEAPAASAPRVSASSVSAMPGRELAEQRFARSAPEAFPPVAPGARIVSSEGMDFEPLPEPIPLAQYNSMVMDELAAGVPGVSGVSGVARREARRSAAPSPASASAAKKAEALSAPLLPLPAALLRGSDKPAPKTVPAALLRGSDKPAPKTVPARVVAKKAAPVAAPAIPELTEVKTAVKIPGAAQFAKVEKALAPLPVLGAPASSASVSASVPTKPRQEKVVVAMPAPVQAPLPTPEAAAAKAALLEFSPEAMDGAFAELNQSEYFKTDFWDPAAKTQRMVEKTPAAQPSFPVLPELAEPGVPGELMIPMPPPLLEEPRKVVLQPIRRERGASEMEAIDSVTEAPPLKF